MHVQSLLRHGSTFGIWETPKEWYEGGSQSRWAVDLRARTIHFLPPELQGLAAQPRTAQPFVTRLLDDAVLSITRYLLICRVGSVGMRRNAYQSMDPAVIAWNAYSFLPILAALAIKKAFKQGGSKLSDPVVRCFSHLIDSDLTSAAVSKKARDVCAVEMLRMRSLHERGLWFDAPMQAEDGSKTTEVAGPAVPLASPPETEPHLPIPDEYVSEMGWKSAWLTTNLGPSLVVALEAFQDLWRRAAETSASAATLSRWCFDYLKDHEWVDASGRRIDALPFPLKLNQLGASRRKARQEAIVAFEWPPRNAAQVLGLCRTLQAAHMFITGLSIGARRTELGTLKRTCVQYAKDGRPYADGRTFKLVRRHDGEERDWQLPDLAVQAIEQQVRLVSLFECLSGIGHPEDPDKFKAGDHLWGQGGGGGRGSRHAPLSNAAIGSCLHEYAQALRMDKAPGGQALRPHRFRKTLARLVALAITHAPKVLQDVFGHKSIEMTLYYILADKDLVAEIEEVAKELRVMRAQEVIQGMVSGEEAQAAVYKAAGASSTTTIGLSLGGYGGSAAMTVQRAVNMHRENAHRRGDDWGAAEVRELAEILTMQGRTWQLVRPGVLCTKAIGQAGPCNKKRGQPEPARCQTKCDYRLEEAWHREDVDATIAEALQLYEDELERGEDLVAELWAGQVRANIGRFPDLEAKWMVNSNVRKLVLSGAAE
jgi:integrase